MSFIIGVEVGQVLVKKRWSPLIIPGTFDTPNDILVLYGYQMIS